MPNEITGTILEIFPEQTFVSGFSKREFVVTTRDRYPQPIKLEFTKERCAQLDGYQPGDPVRVFYNLRGNEYNGRYFVNLQAWRIEPEGAAGPGPGDSPHGPPPYAAAARPGPAPGYQGAHDDDDDIPF